MATANFMIAESVGKEVIYSTTCFKESYSLPGTGTQTFLQVSKTNIKNDVEPQGPGIGTIDSINASITIINGSLTLGMMVTPPPASLVLGALSAVGSLIQVGLSFFGSDEPDPVAEQLKILTQKIKELDEKTTAHFADMKSFITESQFSMEIVSQVSILKKYLQDCLEFLNEESIENFRMAYEHLTPLDIGYNLLHLLNNKSTNPLVMAMEKREITNESVFDKWEKLIKTLFGDLLLIEGIGSGLLYDKDSHDWDRLLELRDEIDEFIHKYKNSYWENFKKGFKSFLESNTHLSKAEKAEKIKKKLEQYVTEDAFYVCVLDQPYNVDDFCCYSANPSQLIEFRNVGNCHAFVYRSTKGNTMKEEDYTKIKEDIDALFKHKFELDYNPEGQVKNYLIPQELVRIDGFICLMDVFYQPEILQINCPGHERGPGWYSWVHRKEIGPYYNLIVGFP